MSLTRAEFSRPTLWSISRAFLVTAAGAVISADGSSVRIEYTAAYDGREYPLVGNSNVNSVSLRRVSRRRVDAVEKKNGAAVFFVSRVVTADGNAMTVTVKGTNARGESVNSVLVFRRK